MIRLRGCSGRGKGTITWRKLGETVPALRLYVQGSCALQRLTSPHRLSASPLQGYFLPACNWHGSSLRLNLDATLMETHSVFSDSGEERRWYEAGQGNEDSLYPRDWLTEGCVTTVHTVRLHGLGRFCLCFPGVSTLTWKLGRGGGGRVVLNICLLSYVNLMCVH